MSDPHPELASYPRINPAFTPIVVNEDEVQFTTGPLSGPVFEIADEDRDGTLRSLVSKLDGSTHVRDVLDSFDPADRDEIRNVILALQAKSVVRDAGDAVSESRAGLDGYLSVSTDSNGAIERVAESSLTVVGAGDVGRVIVENLVEAGVGSIEYLDLSGDANRWIGSLEDPTPSSLPPSSLESALNAATFAVFGVDRPYPDVASRINGIAHRTGTPWIVGQLRGLDGQIGPTILPGETACYDCFRVRTTAATRSRLEYARFERAGDVSGALLPSFAHVVGGMVSLDVLKQLADGFGITPGGVVDFDFHDFAVQAEEVLRLPRCETCGKSADRLDSPRHVTMDHLVERLSGDE